MLNPSLFDIPEYQGWCRLVVTETLHATEVRLLHFYRQGHLLCGRHQQVLDRQSNPTPADALSHTFAPAPSPNATDAKCPDCREAWSALRALLSLQADAEAAGAC